MRGGLNFGYYNVLGFRENCVRVTLVHNFMVGFAKKHDVEKT